jgi:hypothetical protein
VRTTKQEQARLAFVQIAHLSDLHVLAPRNDRDFDVRFVSIGRPLDAGERRRKVLRAFERASAVGADHIVVSGDLTETGTHAQYEAVAEILADARVDPDRITLVPGNHDLYARRDGWRAALDGPLAPYRRGAAEGPGKIVDLGPVRIAPIDLTVHQSVTRSTGAVSRDVAEALAGRLGDPGLMTSAPLLAVQHHPPYPRANPIHQWFDGLRDWARVFQLLVSHAHAFVMHGHLHDAGDRAVRSPTDIRIFGAPAIVDDDARPRVRLYDLRGGVIEATGFA